MITRVVHEFTDFIVDFLVRALDDRSPFLEYFLQFELAIYVFTMKIEPVACIWKLSPWHVFEGCVSEFFLPVRKVTKWICCIASWNLCEIGLFHSYFEC